MVGAGTNSTKEPGRGGPVIVLVRPQLAVNIGMAARAMANFGLSDLRLVAPKSGWPPLEKYGLEAEAAAAGALHLLQAARVFDTIEEAVADLHAVYATTARERGQGKRVLSPDIAMAEWAAPIAAGEGRGILFGPERTGLDSDEIAMADAIVTFPVNQAYGSLNLAQAVLLMGYEWMKQASDAALPFGWVERSRPAPRGAVLSFFTYLEEETHGRRFLPARRQAARHAAQPPQHVPSHGSVGAGCAHPERGRGPSGPGTAQPQRALRTVKRLHRPRITLPGCHHVEPSSADPHRVRGGSLSARPPCKAPATDLPNCCFSATYVRINR